MNGCVDGWVELFRECGLDIEDRDTASLFIKQAASAARQYAKGGFADPALSNMAALIEEFERQP